MRTYCVTEARRAAVEGAPGFDTVVNRFAILRLENPGFSTRIGPSVCSGSKADIRLATNMRRPLPHQPPSRGQEVGQHVEIEIAARAPSSAARFGNAEGNVAAPPLSSMGRIRHCPLRVESGHSPKYLA